MANLYCNQSLVTGSNNGADFDTNAFQTLALALNGSNTVAGDTLWVKNNSPTGGAITIKGVATFTNDPPRVIGCRSDATGSTGTPPTAVMIIPGLRNGSSTLAYDQTGGDAPPILKTTTASTSIRIEGYMQIYGLNFLSAWRIEIQLAENGIKFEECQFTLGVSSAADFKLGYAFSPSNFAAINCKLTSASNQIHIKYSGSSGGKSIFESCILDLKGTTGLIDVGRGNVKFIGCDFSSVDRPIIQKAGGLFPNATNEIENCKMHSTAALVTGSITEEFRSEFIQTSGTTGKTTGGSFRDFNIITNHGNIEVETTRVRTGGGDDGGSGGWSLAFTPSDNGTRTNLVGLVGPWINQKIAGDGTSQTLTVFIANDLAEDAGNTYDDDDVWLELYSPEAAEGAADYDRATTQMDLEATPTEITTETDSTWGSGANNRQKLSISISPDYTGRLRWRVVFSKNFASSADTLYVDPASEIT